MPPRVSVKNSSGSNTPRRQQGPGRNATNTTSETLNSLRSRSGGSAKSRGSSKKSVKSVKSQSIAFESNKAMNNSEADDSNVEFANDYEKPKKLFANYLKQNGFFIYKNDLLN